MDKLHRRNIQSGTSPALSYLRQSDETTEAEIIDEKDVCPLNALNSSSLDAVVSAMEHQLNEGRGLRSHPSHVSLMGLYRHWWNLPKAEYAMGSMRRLPTLIL